VSEYLDELRGLVERGNKCQAVHVATVPVTELFEGKIAWTGEVEVFELTGHPKAKRCYAWGDRGPTEHVVPEKTQPGRGRILGSVKGSVSFTTVLEIPPVVSAETAVKVAIAAKSKTP
jgi:hypothetical protein